MHIDFAKLTLPTVLVGASLSATASGDWLLVHEITSAQVNLLQQESRYFVDVTSLTYGKVDGVRYELANMKTESKGKGTSIDQVAVICRGIPIAPALSIRKMGEVKPDGSIKNTLDFGAPSSVADFRLWNLDRAGEKDIFFLVAQAVCQHRAGSAP